jgi:outer membrane protein assembly factor BamD
MYYILFFCVILIVFSCASKKIKGDLTAEERLEIAKELFDNKKYYDAKQQLTILTYSHRGSAVADEAQFYLAECHYELKEYILAISEYQRLVNAYQNSEYIDDAEYKLGMSYFELSPSAGLDQDYSLKAIAHFQRFLEDYPNSSLRPKVEKAYSTTRDKLAKKEFDNGALYRKMGYYEAAIVYFDGVLVSFYDTKYAEKASFWKAECLYKLEKFEEAQDLFQDFLDRFTQSTFHEKAVKRLDDIKQILSNSFASKKN